MKERDRQLFRFTDLEQQMKIEGVPSKWQISSLPPPFDFVVLS